MKRNNRYEGELLSFHFICALSTAKGMNFS